MCNVENIGKYWEREKLVSVQLYKGKILEMFRLFCKCQKRSWLVYKVETLKVLMKLLKVDSTV